MALRRNVRGRKSLKIYKVEIFEVYSSFYVSTIFFPALIPENRQFWKREEDFLSTGLV